MEDHMMVCHCQDLTERRYKVLSHEQRKLHKIESSIEESQVTIWYQFYYDIGREQIRSTYIMSLTNASPEEAARAAKISSRKLAVLPVSERNEALEAIHNALSDAKINILEANARDLELAIKSAADGELSQSILKRLDLSRKGKYDDMLKGILDVRDLEDPGDYIQVQK